MSPIEKVKELIAKGEKWHYELGMSAVDVLPLLRLLVECEDKLQEHADFKPEIDPAEGDCDPWIRIAAHGKKMARDLLAKLRSES